MGGNGIESSDDLFALNIQWSLSIWRNSSGGCQWSNPVLLSLDGLFRAG